MSFAIGIEHQFCMEKFIYPLLLFLFIKYQSPSLGICQRLFELDVNADMYVSVVYHKRGGGKNVFRKARRILLLNLVQLMTKDDLKRFVQRYVFYFS